MAELLSNVGKITASLDEDACERPAQIVEAKLALSPHCSSTWLESNRERIGSQRFKEVSAEYVVYVDRALQRARRVLGVEADDEANAAQRLPAVDEAT